MALQKLSIITLVEQILYKIHVGNTNPSKKWIQAWNQNLCIKNPPISTLSGQILRSIRLILKEYTWEREVMEDKLISRQTTKTNILQVLKASF